MDEAAVYQVASVMDSLGAFSASVAPYFFTLTLNVLYLTLFPSLRS